MALNLDGLDAFAAEFLDLIDAGLEDGAGMIADLATQLAPEDEGDLKASINKRRGDEGSWEVIAGEGLPDIRAIVQETGSIYQDPQPYMEPAANAIDVEALVKARLRSRL